MPFLPDATALPELEAGELRFRPIVAADAPDLFAIFGDPEVARYWSREAMRGLREAEELATEIRDLFERRSLFQWGLVRPAENRVIGTGTFADLDERHRRAAVGYALARAEWARGVMRAALPALLRFGFETLGLHRIEAESDPRNEASVRLLEGAGFRREGYRREAYFHSGEIQDGVSYGLLRHEYARGRRTEG